MAKLNNDFLMNLIQNTPEVQAGYMPVDTSGIRGLYQPPTGPLYNVDVDSSNLENPYSKLDLGSVTNQRHLKTGENLHDLYSLLYSQIVNILRYLIRSHKKSIF